jgi:hypothetical protein
MNWQKLMLHNSKGGEFFDLLFDFQKLQIMIFTKKYFFQFLVNFSKNYKLTNLQKFKNSNLF